MDNTMRMQKINTAEEAFCNSTPHSGELIVHLGVPELDSCSEVSRIVDNCLQTVTSGPLYIRNVDELLLNLLTVAHDKLCPVEIFHLLYGRSLPILRAFSPQFLVMIPCLVMLGEHSHYDQLPTVVYFPLPRQNSLLN
uniref:Uncharacterized protein n=1 Tax=Glossina pallidipes TaxID=7398 RepID=A0A1B0AHS1_GLOPL